MSKIENVKIESEKTLEKYHNNNDQQKNRNTDK